MAFFRVSRVQQLVHLKYGYISYTLIYDSIFYVPNCMEMCNIEGRSFAEGRFLCEKDSFYINVHTVFSLSRIWDHHPCVTRSNFTPELS